MHLYYNNNYCYIIIAMGILKSATDILYIQIRND